MTLRSAPGADLSPVGERDVAIGSPKQRIVLAMLALARRVSVDALAEELWPETAPASAAATVHTLVSRLRRSVESAGGALSIHAEAGGYVIRQVAWRGAGPLKVRMAVHAGTAEARAGTFLGPTLNRTARLLDQAGGGQILCSQAAADLARDELPTGITLVDFGERLLEGLARPEQIWQVRHPEIPLCPSPTRTTVEPRPPSALTPFVGREAERTELAALLAGTRLLTITGVGGAGKTRLALELSARTETGYADGAHVVELASVQDDRPLAGMALSALGVEGGRSSGLAAEEQLCRALASQELLLVLDNCEHVLVAAGALADTVLRRCPNVTILATSREVLSLAGETVWAAPSLSLPPPDAKGPDDLAGSDAAALFLVRARTAQPGFGVVPANAGAIARICRRLDGIPLALELAAARVRVLSATQLADRLDDRLRLLTSGPRSAPVRHQTLRATMDWSFELLSDPEQRLLRRLSVCPQDFDLEAATAVADDDADAIDVVDLLARLVDKSLLVPEGVAETARYRLLETVRQYGAEKLAGAGEQGETRSAGTAATSPNGSSRPSGQGFGSSGWSGPGRWPARPSITTPPSSPPSSPPSPMVTGRRPRCSSPHSAIRGTGALPFRPPCIPWIRTPWPAPNRPCWSRVS